MKRFHLSTRVAALILALSMIFTLAACGDRSVKPTPDGSSSSDVSSSVPAFINPLPDVDLTAIAKPEPPAADLLAKINTAYNQNNDVVGWISLSNTTINDEVLHYTDNLYYERRDITKGYNWHGCYWADFECKFGDRNSISKNTIIYGHSMDDNPEGVKFSQLKKLNDKDFAAANPYINFSTPEDNMVWKIFSVMYTDTNLAYIHPEMKNSEFMKLVGEAKLRSKLNYDVDVNASDKILTLSTCTYPTNNKEINDHTRFVVMARLVRPGEKIEPTVKVEVNANVKAPQYK
ncbi:class B sortase [Oscillospiraceae bacterium PP1C4]